MNGNDATQCARETIRLIDKSEADEIAVRIAALCEGIASQTIAKVVDQAVRDGPAVADDEAFRLAPGSRRWSIGELAGQGVSIVLVIAAQD